MQVPFGQRELELGGKYIAADLRDSNELLDDVAALRARMEEDGYLLIRGLYDREQVLGARRALLERINEAGGLAPDAPLMDGVINPDKTAGGPVKQYTDTPAFRALVESPQIMGFFANFLGGDVLTFDYKWLRIVGTGGGTGAHYDVVYMGRGTKNLYTTWTPLGDITLDMGTLCLCLGSQRFEKVKQTYGQSDVDRDHHQGWFSNDPVEVVDKFGGRWATTEFQAGDALIFGMFMMHASLKNTTNRYRISSDTRYQLATDPVDERWVGESPIAHYAWMKEPAKMVPMEVARKQWGLD